MSGTSADGLDLCLASFNEFGETYAYQIVEAKQIDYPQHWSGILRQAHTLSAEQLIKTHTAFGIWCARQILHFLQNHQNVTAIAFHGSTVFHQPEHQISFQLGHPATISRICALPVVADFRSADLLLQGRGAPLVPFGDEMLFPEYDVCLNLGGFANYSAKVNGVRLASDLCIANYALNHLARQKNQEYDPNGEGAAAGTILPDLLQNLHNAMHKLGPGPHALTREWAETHLLPLLNSSEINNQLATVCEHIAMQISHQVPIRGKWLVSGGGAHNQHLMQRLSHHLGIPLPHTGDLINHKEALIFAFLGLRRLNGQINCLASVTGARNDHSTGTIYS